MKTWLVSVVLTVGLLVVPATGENPIAVAQTSHPRLFFTAADIPRLQRQAQSTHADIWAPIFDYADSLVGTTPPAATPVTGDEEAFRQYGNQLIPLAFTCVITQAENYCDLARDYLLTYAGWSQWDENNFRDLGLAHMLLGSTLAYDWLFNRLSPAEQQTARAALSTWAQRLYEASIEPKHDEWNNWWPQSYAQNHASTNHSALGMAGLALSGEDVNAPVWVDRARSELARDQALLAGIGDGSWHEGISYQNYKLTMLLPFAYNLKRLQGVNILADTYLNNYVLWRIYNHLPGKVFGLMNFGNLEFAWGNSYAPENVLRFIAREYRNGRAEWMAQQLSAAEGRDANVFRAPWYVFEFLYYDPAVAARQPANSLPPRRTFPDLEGVIWRTGWEQDDLLFGLKTGVYGGRFAFDTFVAENDLWKPPCAETGCQLNIGHDHDDTNTFYIYRRGSWLAPENMGAGLYDTSYHNTLLIDGEGQARPPDDSWRDPNSFEGLDGRLTATANSRNFDYLAADATRRYAIDDLETVTRYVLFVRPDYFVMLDHLAAAAPHRYDWVLHFDAGVTVEGNWVRGDADDGQILGVGIVSPPQFQAETGDDGYPYVRVRPAENTPATRLLHILYPTDAAAWDSRPETELLDDTGAMIAARLRLAEGGQHDVILAYAGTLSSSAVGPYAFDGRAAFIGTDAEQNMERLWVHGGSALDDLAGDRGVIVNGLSPAEPFEAVYQADRVAVYGTIVSPVRLYAPDAQQLTVNNQPTAFVRDGRHIIFPAEPQAAGDTVPGVAALIVQMVAEPPFAAPNTQVDWTITITNPNPAPGTQVVVEDHFPDEIEVLSASSPAGSVAVRRQRLTGTQAVLGPDQSLVIRVNSRIRSDTRIPFIITNQASVRSAEHPQPVFAAATVVSATELPSTGESPWQVWRSLVLIIAVGAGGFLLNRLYRSPGKYLTR